MNLKFSLLALLMLAILGASVAANTLPSVSIVSPQNNASFLVGTRIDFRATANDAEDDPNYYADCGYDGTSRQDCFRWTAIPIGTPNQSIIMSTSTTGTQVSYSQLPQGDYSIFFTAVDRAGETGYDSILVHVTPPISLPGPSVIVVSPRFSLPSEWTIKDDEEYHSFRLMDYVGSSTNPDQLVFDLLYSSSSQDISCRIVSKYLECRSTSSGREGDSSRVEIRVTDLTSGKTASDTMQVVLEQNSPSNDDPELNLPSQWFISGDGSYDSLDLWNYASDNQDSDSRLSFTLTSWSNSSDVDCYISQDRYLYCRASNGGEGDNSRVTIEVEDTDGRIARDTMTVFIENDSSGGTTDSRDIDLQTRSLGIQENDTQTFTFYVENSGPETFIVDSVEAFDRSNYLFVEEMGEPTQVNAYSTASVQIRVRATAVSSDRTETGYFKVQGHFRGHSAFVKEEQFDVTVYNGSGTYYPPTGTTGRWVDVSPGSVTLKPGQSEAVLVNVYNDSGSRRCYTLRTQTNSVSVLASLNDEDFCLGSRSSRTVNGTVRAATSASAGYYSAEVITRYNGQTDTQSISVKVETDETPPVTPQPPAASPAKVEVSQYPTEVTLNGTESKTITLTLLNSGDEAADGVIVSLKGLPSGLEFQPVVVGTLGPNATRQVQGELKGTGAAASGTYSVTAEITSSTGTQSVPLTIKVENGATGTGLVGLAQPVAIGIGAAIVLAVAVGLVYFLVRPKTGVISK
ncbi:MAG: hypothetical protein HY917_04965 [Candidatus Diapherotrites archaeon]|nr:hypothetical protein [Candidatus Diapherotrites archaeon]